MHRSTFAIAVAALLLLGPARAAHAADDAGEDAPAQSETTPSHSLVDPDQPIVPPSGGGAGGPIGRLLSVWIQQDVTLVSGTDVCAEASQLENGYACFRQQGTQYHGNPVIGQGDRFNGGLALATTRVVVGYDQLVGSSFTAGLRLGYAFRGGSPKPDGADAKPFLPVSGELRGTYWMGEAPFGTEGIHPYAFAAAGFAEVDTHFSVPVTEDTSMPPPSEQIDNPPQQMLDAYKKMGRSFAGAGAGVLFATAPGRGWVAEAKLVTLFPSTGFAIMPSVGYAFGM